MSFFLCVVNGHLFGVQTSEVIVPTFSDDPTVLDQHAADQRIGADLSATSLSNQQGMFHEHAICIAPILSHTSPRNLLFMTACMPSTDEKVSKSVNLFIMKNIVFKVHNCKNRLLEKH